MRKGVKKMSECATTDHGFLILSRDFFKQDSFGKLDSFDQQVSYSTLFCAKCGKVIEVVSRNKKHKE